ncbi:carbohydrate porin [Dyella ginsengisoli]|uniref:Carbohydrate porin n=1 Tax=Dyella ginsengisoli TaxID=363848 RepID=A0ABW8JVM4_9GAMM
MPQRIAIALGALLALATTQARADDTGWANTTLTYDGAAIGNIDGGVARSSTYVGNLHLRSRLDLERALGWTGTHAYVDALWIHGGQPGAFVGDAMGVSNLSAPPNLQLEEAWIEHNLANANVSVLAGLYDVNSEFDRTQSGGLFLNSAFGIGPEFAQTGVDGPSIFPRTALGARVAYKPAEGVVLRAAVLDGVPLIRDGNRLRAFRAHDGLLYVAELALLDRPGARPPGDARLRIGRNAMLPMYAGKLAIGAWHYTTTFDRLAPASGAARQHGASGYYAVADRTVARDARDSRHSLSLFAQFGAGDPAVARFGRYVGAGAVLAGPFEQRRQDELGLAIAVARNGRPYRQQQAPRPITATERSIELSYLAQATEWLAVQPDLQYVIHPDTDPTVRNALVFSLRFELSTDL